MDASTLVDELLESEELTKLLATDPYGNPAISIFWSRIGPILVIISPRQRRWLSMHRITPPSLSAEFS